MRILFLSHYVRPHIGGIEAAIDGLARELLHRGHQVTVIASDAGREYGSDDEAGGADHPQIIRVRAFNALERRAAVPYPVFSPSLLPVVRREVQRTDVVHAHGLLYMPSVAGLAYAKRLAGDAQRPVRVLTEHVGHVTYESRILDRVQASAINTIGRVSVRAAETVIVLNDKVRHEMTAMARGQRIVQIENGVDTARYRPPTAVERAALRRELGWDDRPRVLFVGRLVPKKGFDIALGAAATARDSFELVVAGPGRVDPATPANVRMLGPLPPEEVARLYRAADVFLLPSHGEGFPVTVQEAMASGLPVVLSDDPTYRSHADRAGPGMTLTARTPAAVSQALEKLVGSAEALAAAREAATRFAQRAFSWEASAQAHEQVYEALRAERRRSGCQG